jgi:uncharacterized protein (DUF1800 family)
MNATLRALNGFGLGARPGERRRITDPRGWLRAQLQGSAPPIRVPAEARPEAIVEAIRAFRMPAPLPGNNNGRQPQDRPQAQSPAQQQAQQQARQQAQQRLRQIASAEGHVALSQRVTTDRPFVERLVAFWSNHLCVSVAAKVLVAPLAGSYEREAIRPHVLGRFEDMVLASARHPAMLVYLDNFQSVGPNSRGASASGRGRGQQRRGLNENYARELLELHTLGVDGGYTQQDVQELAEILTGWTVTGLNRDMAAQMAPLRGRGRAAIQLDTRDTIGFAFQEPLHEPGSKTLLGVRYAEAGRAEAERAIRALCQHPSTARFVATKLVTHFVSDEPPAAAVDRLAQVFRDTQGDLRAVSAALIDLPEAWQDNARKFRTPQDWLVAMLRAAGATESAATLMPTLRQLRHPLWSPQSPKGFGDTAQEWADPDSLLNRAELARTGARRLRMARVDPRDLLDVVDVATDDPLPGFLGDSAIAVDERIALAFAGPAFQWR